GRWVLLGALAIAIVLRFRFSQDRRFKVTPLDVLIVCSALIVPNLPDSFASHAALGESVARLVVLFYALEALLARGGRHWRELSLAGVAFLAAAAAPGLF